MEGRMLRRSVTLADQLAAVGPAAASSCNLRDLLKLRDEDDLAAGRRAAVTLASAMAAERRASSSSSSSSSVAAAAARTLLDIIRDDQLPPAPAPAGPVISLPVRSSPSGAATPAPEEEQGERVSLMALLEQTERQWSGGGASRAREEEMVTTVAEALGLDDEVETGKGGGGVGGGCCVCMTRPKGAAFIPCGHTFCRSCARELSAGRGRCPLCNAAIVDILDIF